MRTIPEYGASIKIEEARSAVYLREKALDAVQEQVIDDLNDALAALNGLSTTTETSWEEVNETIALLSKASGLAMAASEIAFSKRPAEDDE